MNLGNLFSIDKITESDMKSIDNLRQVIKSPKDKRLELREHRQLVLLQANINHARLGSEHTLFGAKLATIKVTWYAFLYKCLTMHYVHKYRPLIVGPQSLDS